MRDVTLNGLEIFNSPTGPYVLAFARLMEMKLAKNRHKGDRENWIEDSAESLLDRLREETTELHSELYRKNKRVGLEAADVANFAMMIADVAGDLKPINPADPLDLSELDYQQRELFAAHLRIIVRRDYMKGELDSDWDGLYERLQTAYLATATTPQPMEAYQLTTTTKNRSDGR